MIPRPLDLINRSIGLGGVRVARDIAYGDDPRQKLDIYRSARYGADRPVIVFFYGGSWQGGSRADYAFIAALLVRRGFVVAVPDYRVYPAVVFPAFLQDCALAVDYVFENIAAHGGGGKIFLLGHSAGAYNAVMLGLADFLPARDRLAGIIGISGPYDFLPLRDKIIKTIFGRPADIRQTQPINHARGDAPPMLLLSGGADYTVLPRNTTALGARQRQMGGHVTIKIYPRLGHIGIILTFLPYFNWRAPVLADILAFLESPHTVAHSESATDLLDKSR